MRTMRIPLPARRRRQRGFTLIEAGIALVIMGLLLSGTVTLYIASLRNTGAASTQVQATLDAAGAIQYIMVTAREAMSVALPSDTTTVTGTPAWAPPTGATSSYLSSGVATGIQLTFADNATSAATTATVLGANGSAISPAPKVYDHNNTGLTVWIYRADASGTPNPTTGTYLHMKTKLTNGTYQDRNIAKMVLKTRTDAVSFTRPATSQTEFSVELVSGGYSPISPDGQETDENSNGILVPLSGKCVLMRNHKVNS